LVIYDIDDFTELASNLSAHDYIGECEFLLNDVLCPRPKTLQKDWENKRDNVKKKRKLGSCFIRGNDLDVGG